MGIRKNIFNIESLLRDYRQGGTKAMPVKRTLATISTKLILADQVPPNIAGAAVFDTFYDIAYRGLTFEGNGKWGSKGDELFQHIRAKCVEIGKKTATEQLVGNVLAQKACVANQCPARSLRLIPQTRFQRAKRFMQRPRGYWAV